MYQPVPGAEILEVPPEVQEMFDWAAARGVRWPKIVYPVRFPPGYIGSMATEEIHPNERIVIAPNKALFTSKVARESADLKTVFENCPESFSKSMLGLVTFLVWEKSKGPSSEWAPFIKYQPKNPSNYQDWTDTELLELQDTDAMQDAKKRREYHEYGWRQWKQVLSKCPQFTEEMLSLEEYTWAFRVIGTRSFGKFMPHITLFPVGELLNHDNVQTYYIYQHEHERPDSSSRYSGIVDEIDHDDDLLTTDTIIDTSTELLLNINEQFNKASKDMEKLLLVKQICKEVDTKEKEEAKEHKKYRPPNMDLTESDAKDASICTGPTERYLPGSEVYMSYGRYSNRQLLSTYGFSLKQNYFNYARIKILLQEMTLDQRLGQFLSEVQAFIVFKLKKNILGDDFIRSIRALHWRFELSEKNFLHPVDLNLEKIIIDTGIHILTKYLRNFRTTYEEDLSILNEEIDLRKYFAVLFRSQVKEIILNQVKFLKIAKEIIQRLSEGKDFEASLGLVPETESETGKFYLEYEENRRALRSYLEKLR